LPSDAKSLGGGIWTTGTGRQSRYVFAVSGGRVKSIGVAKSGVAQGAKKLNRLARLALSG
jgi:hypothetical protein